MSKFLDFAQWGCLFLGLSLGDIETIMSILALIASVAIGVVSLIIKYKYYNRDGKITKEEMEDLLKDINNIKEKLKK